VTPSLICKVFKALASVSRAAGQMMMLTASVGVMFPAGGSGGGSGGGVGFPLPAGAA
jgi:hypothetical protein